MVYFRAVLVQALTTGHKIGLGVVAAVFIAFALASAFLFPRFRPSFPGGGLPAFIVVTFVFFFGMLTAVEVFGAEPKEKGEEHAEPTSEPTTTEQPRPTTTVVLPAPTTTTGKPKPKPKPAAKPQTVAITETEFKISPPSKPLKAGEITFDVKNAGKTEHDLVVTGNGVTKGTPRFNGGESRTLTVTLKPGTYELFCSVPGHKQAGMDRKITVGS